MMMSSMSKLLMSSLVATMVVSAAGFDIEKFVKSNVIKNPQVKVNTVKTVSTKDIPGENNWKAYLIMVDLTFKGKAVKEPMTVFVDETSGLATMSLMNAKTGQDYQKTIKPNMPDSYYDEAHLISGDKNSKHKVVIFSDPQCPFCMTFVPEVVKEVKDSPENIALYYYHMPLLRLHPVAEVLTRVIEVLQKEGKKELAMKVYSLKISAKETNEDRILAELKKQLDIEVSKDAIGKADIKAAVKKDMEMATQMMVRGTPTIYFDGEYDSTREKYKAFIK
ncbi:MAG TPA: DsbA family protein [Sulfurovum sp.]|nr:DsbA family protein [Sulfurovum sp.]